jgi:hypothetical protein
MADRQYSQRELEQMELHGESAQEAVDAVDARWPEIAAAAATVMDCHKALVNLGAPEDVAYTLVPSVVKLLVGGK